MTLYYPHIQKSLDTITHICADRGRVDAAVWEVRSC